MQLTNEPETWRVEMNALNSAMDAAWSSLKPAENGRGLCLGTPSERAMHRLILTRSSLKPADKGRGLWERLERAMHRLILTRACSAMKLCKGIRIWLLNTHLVASFAALMLLGFNIHCQACRLLEVLNNSSHHLQSYLHVTAPAAPRPYRAPPTCPGHTARMTSAVDETNTFQECPLHQLCRVLQAPSKLHSNINETSTNGPSMTDMSDTTSNQQRRCGDVAQLRTCMDVRKWCSFSNSTKSTVPFPFVSCILHGSESTLSDNARWLRSRASHAWR